MLLDRVLCQYCTVDPQLYKPCFAARCRHLPPASFVDGSKLQASTPLSFQFVSCPGCAQHYGSSSCALCTCLEILRPSPPRSASCYEKIGLWHACRAGPDLPTPAMARKTRSRLAVSLDAEDTARGSCNAAPHTSRFDSLDSCGSLHAWTNAPPAQCAFNTRGDGGDLLLLWMTRSVTAARFVDFKIRNDFLVAPVIVCTNLNAARDCHSMPPSQCP